MHGLGTREDEDAPLGLKHSRDGPPGKAGQCCNIVQGVRRYVFHLSPNLRTEKVWRVLIDPHHADYWCVTDNGNPVGEMVSIDPSLSLNTQSAFVVLYALNLSTRVFKAVFSIAMRTLDRLRKAPGVVRAVHCAELGGDEAARGVGRNHGTLCDTVGTNGTTENSTLQYMHRAENEGGPLLHGSGSVDISAVFSQTGQVV